MRDAGPRGLRAVLALALLGLPAACGDGVDERRAALCRRAVPALAPEGTSASILRIGAGTPPGSVRVHYRLSGRPGASARARWIVCGFGPEGSLTTIATESGPVAGASVYLLRRYYLDTPDAAADDPGSR